MLQLYIHKQVLIVSQLWVALTFLLSIALWDNNVNPNHFQKQTLLHLSSRQTSNCWTVDKKLFCLYIGSLFELCRAFFHSAPLLLWPFWAFRCCLHTVTLLQIFPLVLSSSMPGVLNGTLAFPAWCRVHISACCCSTLFTCICQAHCWEYCMCSPL